MRQVFYYKMRRLLQNASEHCFQKFRNIHWKTLVLESLSNIKYQISNYQIEILQYRCFPLNIAKCSRTPILKNVCELLLLSIYYVNINNQKIIGYLPNFSMVNTGPYPQPQTIGIPDYPRH